MLQSTDRRLARLALAILLASPALTLGAEPVIVIDDGDGEILIDDGSGAAGSDELIIDDTPGALGGDVAAPVRRKPQRTYEIRVDDAWLEYGQFTDRNAEADRSVYGKVAALANWQPSATWELQLAGRLDGHEQAGDDDFSELDADYGDSFVRYRGDSLRVTLGTQTVIWGRLDELPLSDRVSTVDLTRLVLDDLEDRRRANPMLRAEALFGAGKLDLVWLIDFRAAELPDRASVWYPINRQSGRILGIDPDDLAPALVRGALIDDDAPSGDGGFGARYTRTHSLADFGLTVAHTRQSTPYFRAAGAGRFVAEYPRAWSYGADAALDAAGATWRVELLYSSDQPVTRRDLSYTTTAAISWGGGVEFHPGDGDTRINLQLIGTNLIDAPTVLDRKEIYSFNGQIEAPFDRARWRAKLDFYIGLDEPDTYLRPELTFLGWEPHEIYAALHYFDGDDRALGGFHEDHSSLNIGWRASF